MIIRKIEEDDYGKLVELYRTFFETHNRFQQSEGHIINYLKEQGKENEIFIFEEEGNIKGALILVLKGQNVDSSHKVWKFRHFAYDSESVALSLLKYVEEKIKERSPTAKIELTIAENENGVEFYRVNGYEQEGALKNHYRWGETCFILSKSLR